MDQRGNGFSIPNLKCSERDEALRTALKENASSSQIQNEIINATLSCRDRLIAAKVELEAYNLKENVADFEDLRKALDISHWNLYGVSYGSLIAQGIISQFPNGIRSATLDAVVHPNDNIANIESTNALDQRLALIFERCEAQTDCSRDYPDLEQRFWEEIDRLNQTPQTVRLVSEEYEVDYDVPFNGKDLLLYAQLKLEFSSTMEFIPYRLDRAVRGFYSDVLKEMREDLEDTSFSFGTMLSTLCMQSTFNDTTALTTLPVHQTIIDKELDSYNSLLLICNSWPVNKANKLDISISSNNIPTLILNGEFDIRTPTADAMTVSQLLNHAYFAEIPDIGHGAINKGCARIIRDDFLENPYEQPETQCIEETEPSVFFKPKTKSTSETELIPSLKKWLFIR